MSKESTWKLSPGMERILRVLLERNAKGMPGPVSVRAVTQMIYGYDPKKFHNHRSIVNRQLNEMVRRMNENPACPLRMVRSGNIEHYYRVEKKG